MPHCHHDATLPATIASQSATPAHHPARRRHQPEEPITAPSSATMASAAVDMRRQGKSESAGFQPMSCLDCPFVRCSLTLVVVGRPVSTRHRGRCAALQHHPSARRRRGRHHAAARLLAHALHRCAAGCDCTGMIDQQGSRLCWSCICIRPNLLHKSMSSPEGCWSAVVKLTAGGGVTPCSLLSSCPSSVE